MYRRPLTLDPPTPVDGFQVRVVLTSSNFIYPHASNDGADVRFTDTNDNLLDYWIEDWTVDDTSTIWVEVPSSGASEFHMYYGNGSACSASDGDAVFEFFDGFEGVVTATDHFAGNGLFIPFTRVSPPAIYAGNRTYVVYQGTQMDPYVVAYDHSAAEWSPSHQAGDNQLGNDDHGAPAIVRDAAGYLHVFFGTHNTQIQHAKSAMPDDVSAWVPQPDVVCGGASYQQCVVLPNGDIYLFYRKFLEYGPGYYNRTMAYVRSTDNGDSWSAPAVVVDFGEINNWIYPGGIDVAGTSEIHLGWVWCVPLSSPAIRRGVYHACLNLEDGHMYGMDGVDLGSTISKTEADAHCLAPDCGEDNVFNPKVHVDDNGTPYVIFNRYGTNLEFSRWDGSSWTAPETILPGSAAPDFIVHSATDIEAYLVSENYASIEKWRWDGTTWFFDSTVYERTASYISLPKVVLGGVSELEVVFGEEEDDFSTPLKVFAYGDEGFVGSEAVEVDGNKWTGDTAHGSIENGILTYDGGADDSWHFMGGIAGGTPENYTAPIVIEFAAIMHTSSGSRRDAMIGLWNTESGRRAYVYRQGANDYNWYSTWDTAWEEGTGNFTYDIWTQYRIAWKPEAVDFYYKDAGGGSLETPDVIHTVQVPTGEMNPFMGSRWGALECDWYRSRKHTEIEPVVTVGEEHAGGTVADDDLRGERSDIILYGWSANPLLSGSGSRIGYGLSQACDVSVRIYNLSGQLVETLVNEMQAGGDHSVSWTPGPRIGCGKFFYCITAGGAVATGECVVLR